MNDEVIDILEPVEESQGQTERIVEAPRPLVPRRTVIKFKITDERNNSQN